jgi:cobalt/nickel transport system permease protein
MTFAERCFDVGRLDRLSYQETWVHRLDPRAKVIATFLFLLTVVSFPKYEIVALIPFSFYPALLMAIGDIPVRFIIRKIIVVSPFAVCIGIFNPLFDPGTYAILPGFSISAGWISFGSMLLKFALTVSAALLLVATTSFPGACHALRRLGVPALLVSQFLFLYRYLFVLMEETARIVRARDMRSFGRRGLGMGVFSRIAGILFLRTVDRAERIYGAMLSRGFQGDMPQVKRPPLAATDAAFVAVVLVFLLFFRFTPFTEGIGRLAQGLWQ